MYVPFAIVFINGAFHPTRNIHAYRMTHNTLSFPQLTITGSKWRQSCVLREGCELYLRGRNSKFLMLLGAFVKVRKATTSKFVSLSPTRKNSAPTGRIFMKFYIFGYFFRKLRRGTNLPPAFATSHEHFTQKTANTADRRRIVSRRFFWNQFHFASFAASFEEPLLPLRSSSSSSSWVSVQTLSNRLHHSFTRCSPDMSAPHNSIHLRWISMGAKCFAHKKG